MSECVLFHFRMHNLVVKHDSVYMYLNWDLLTNHYRIIDVSHDYWNMLCSLTNIVTFHVGKISYNAN